MAAYSPFDAVRTPHSPFAYTSIPAGVAGFRPDNSVFNLQRRVPLAHGPTTFGQNVSSRVPTGWAVNPYGGRIPVLTGNGFDGGQV